MRTFIAFFCVFLTTLCGFGQGPTFNFSQMVNPDPNQKNLGSVLLIGDRALSGSSTSQLYYDGSSWTIISSQAIGRISGIDKGGGEIHAFFSSTALYSWNDSTNSWGLASNYPAGSFSFFFPFVLSDNNVYLVTDDNEKYGWIYHWDGSVFTALKSDYWYTYSAIYVKDQNNVFTTTSENTNYDPMFLRYSNLTKNNSVLFTFPDDRGDPISIQSKDNNIFFILTHRGDVWKWDNSLTQMTKVFSYTSTGFGSSLIVIDNDNLLTCGFAGIKHIKVSTGQDNVVYTAAINQGLLSSSYNGNGRAIFTGENGIILDVQVIGSVPDESLSHSLNLYPNPAINSVTLEFPVFGVNEKTVELYSSTGQLVKRETFQSFKTTLDISALPSGIYLVQVKDETGKKLASQKLLVR